MRSLCIVACGKKKIYDENPEAGPVKAENLYTGLFTRKSIEYAKRFHQDSWCILSAKYGFLYHDEVVQGPYNQCFHDKASSPITLDELSLQIKSRRLDKYERIIILGGKYYTTIIRKLFNEKEVYNPLTQCKGIGHMMKKLNDSINEV